MATIKFGAGVETTPGVYTREVDLTPTASSGASTAAGFAGVFSWGPVDEPRLISSEADLESIYHRPTNSNFETWFTAANFVAYADTLYVNRAVDANTLSAIANSASANASTYTVYNSEDYTIKSGSFTNAVQFIAKYPGAIGNSLKVSACGSLAQYSSTVDLQSNTHFADANTKIAFSVGSNVATITLANTQALTGNTPNTYASSVAAQFTVGDYLTVGNTTIGTQDIKITAIGTPVIANTAGTNTGTATIAVSLAEPVKVADDFVSTAVLRSWEYRNLVDSAPKTTWSVATSGNTAAIDGMHVVVVDEDGLFTSRPGTVLEVFENVSRATDARTADGNDNYVKNVINNNSRYIWFASPAASMPVATGLLVASSSATAPFAVSFTQGADGGDEANISVASIANAFLPYAAKTDYDLSAVVVGKTRGGVYGEQILNWVIDNIGEARQDLLVYGSLPRSAVVNNSNSILAAQNFRGATRRSSYGELDSGYKYMYDRYSNVYRHVPLCGDIAGLSCRTDVTNDPWYSPAGYSRGEIKNIIKLSWNPSPSEMKILFNNDINPVVTEAGEGTFLMGDKTMLGYQSAFDAVGVRKMFNILKKNLSRASKRLLFEFNDEFSQQRFKNICEPLLRDFKGRRGISSFQVVCDDTNNTQQVKANKQFVGDIYIVPAYSTRTIHLNFVAVNSLSEFSETVL